MRRYVMAIAAAAAVTFGLVTASALPATPAVTPVLTATPSTDLVDLQEIEVHGTGFPQAPGVVAQCVVGGSCDEIGPWNQLADADGRIDILVSVHVRTDISGLPGGNCMVTACDIRAMLADGTVLARVPLTFRAGQTLPPYLTVTPSTGLRHDQTVLVTGAAYAPGQRVFLTECAGGYSVCAETLQSTAVDADANGAFATFVKVSRIIDQGSPGFPRYEDCATYFQRCWMTGVYAGPNGGPISYYGSGPLGFDGSTAPPATPPTVTSTPPRIFPAVDTPVFDLANFTPGEPVRSRFCAVKNLHVGCGPWVTAVPDVSGAAHVSIEIRRLSVAPDGTELDCIGPTVCSITTEGVFAYERVRTFVDFDPSSPIPGRPTVTLHDLTVTEGSDGGQTPARMRITLSEPSADPLTVEWATGLVVPYQFNPPGGRLTIPAGAVEATLPLRVVADPTDEADGDVPVEIFPGRVFAVALRHATLRILDDDAPSADPPAVAYLNLGEGVEGNPIARAIVHLASPAQHTVVVHYRTVDASAVAGSDYVAKSRRITFLPGETRHVLRFEILDDDVQEGPEHFHVLITKVEGGIRARGNNVDIFDGD